MQRLTPLRVRGHRVEFCRLVRPFFGKIVMPFGLSREDRRGVSIYRFGLFAIVVWPL
jgi:hypothetical protein